MSTKRTAKKAQPQTKPQAVEFACWQPLGAYAERVVRMTFATYETYRKYMWDHPNAYASPCSVTGAYPNLW